MKKITLAFIAILISMASFAQVKGNISGTIKDGGDEKVIASATVSLLRAKDSSLAKVAVADKLGNFSFEGVKDGNYFVSVTAVGHLKAFSGVFPIDDAHPSKNLDVLQLQTSASSLGAVTVVAKKPFIERKADRTIINVEASATNAGSTAMEVLEKSPGVAVDKDGNISLKGKQGVIVMIDGKQTYMSAQDLANYLQSLPSSNIEAIELMPNPSSKYDAAGRSGMINIRMKKNKLKGFNGSVNSTFGQGKYSRAFNSLNLNYRNGKFNFTSSLGSSYRRDFQQFQIHREYFTPAGNRTAVFDQGTRFNKERNNENAKFGLDFYATKKTTLGLVVSGYITPNTQHSSNTSFLKDGNETVNSILATSSRDKEKWQNGSVNLNLSHRFDSAGTTITADADMLNYKGIHTQQFYSDNYTPLWEKQSSDILVSDLPSAIKVYSLKTDFSKPFKSGLKLEAGAKTSYVKTDNNAGYFNVIAGLPYADYTKSNNFTYSENINAGYVNLSRDIKKWSLQAGLRLENTNYKGKQFGNPTVADSSFKRSYTNLFPTVFAGYKMNEKNEFGFSYGRRISRPDYQDLNPFIFFIDKYTYEAGNPFLKPMFANTFEVSHTYNKFLTTTLNYTSSKDKFNEFFTQSGYATIVRQNNYGKASELSLSVTAELNPVKWLSIIPYAEYNYNRVQSMIGTLDIDTKSGGFTTNIQTRFKLGKGWGAELSGFYRTSMREAQFKIGSMGQANAGISKQVLKGKGSLKLNVTDIFYTNKQKGEIQLENAIAKFTQVRDSRYASLNFSYRFGKPYKTQQRRTGGAGDEQNRIKSN